jgi:hypothetical protein
MRRFLARILARSTATQSRFVVAAVLYTDVVHIQACRTVTACIVVRLVERNRDFFDGTRLTSECAAPDLFPIVVHEETIVIRRHGWYLSTQGSADWEKHREEEHGTCFRAASGRAPLL